MSRPSIVSMRFSATTGTCLRAAAIVFALVVFITSPSPHTLANFRCCKVLGLTSSHPASSDNSLSEMKSGAIFNHPEGLTKVIQLFQEQNIKYDRIVGLDARGFPMAGALSAITGKPFAMARKKGKLPGETISTEYELEYGTDELHLQSD